MWSFFYFVIDLISLTFLFTPTVENVAHCEFSNLRDLLIRWVWSDQQRLKEIRDKHTWLFFFFFYFCCVQDSPAGPERRHTQHPLRDVPRTTAQREQHHLQWTGTVDPAAGERNCWQMWPWQPSLISPSDPGGGEVGRRDEGWVLFLPHIQKWWRWKWDLKKKSFFSLFFHYGTNEWIVF